MQDSKQEFTVFYEHEDSFSSAVFDAGSIEDALEHFVAAYRHRPVAWSTERTVSHGGTRLTGALRRESIAAGRRIEYDIWRNCFVAFGAGKQEAPKPAATLGDLLRRALDRPLVRPGMTFVATVPDGLSVTPADLAMVARDGPAKPAAVVIPKPAEPTAKPAISGLQRVYSSTHLLGSYR